MDAMRSPAITAREFAEAYARRSGYTLREFAEMAGHRRVVRPCACDSEMCEGWGMTPVIEDDELVDVLYDGEPGIPLADLA